MSSQQHNVNSKTLGEKWAEAEATGRAVKIGETVVCDVCDTDYTQRQESGGFIFDSYAYCPECAKKELRQIEAIGEEGYIRARCPDGQSFADFVRAYRGPNASIQITKGFRP